MEKDLNKILIESMIRNAMKDFNGSSGRTVRNLIDLGVNFSKGRFQKSFLRVIQEMLANRDSEYYQLFSNVVCNVDKDYLINFGMTLGYNSCTKGAKTIREIEEKKNFNVPWALVLNLSPKRLKEATEDYLKVINQGKAMGIHTYLLFMTEEEADIIIPIFEQNKDCAFIIFIRGHQVNDVFLTSAKKSGNVLVAIYNNKDAQSACEALQKNKMLYGVYQRYTEKDKDEIVNGKWLSDVLKYKPQFALLLPTVGCYESVQEEIYKYISGVREGQTAPVLFVEVIKDLWTIDNIISDDAYLVGFERDGSMRTYTGVREEREYNIFENKLENILQIVTVK